jgi:hypothetical protein
MFKDYLEANTLVVVLLGKFNPAIIQPFWLAKKGLIREQEAENARVQVIHNDFTKINLDFVEIEVTIDRLVFKTTQEPYFEPLKDLIVGIFNILSEEPITAFGINHLRYYDLRDENRFYNFGNKLAPLNNWDEKLNDPRLFTLEILESNRLDKLNGQYRIKILPPDIKLASKFCILIHINDHIEVEKNDFLNQFLLVWGKSFERADEVINSVWNKIN